MKKQSWIWTAALWAGLCIAGLLLAKRPVVQAKDREAEKGELASRGNLIYRDSGKEAGIYEADFSLLWRKLSSVSGEIFDPAEYTHMHRWEYREGDEHTHTRYCALCGEILTGVHKAESEEDCTISHEGEKYPGRSYRCACGYRWEREAAHALTFDMVDETCHKSRCLLDGTAYCPGYESVEEEHYAYSLTADPTGTRWIKTCIDCGYQTEEEIEPDAPSSSVSENTIEETELPTSSETVEEEKAAELPETAGEEKETLPPGAAEKETPLPEATEITGGETKEPEISVSGNDCAGDEEQSGTEEKTIEIADEEGEKR